MVFIQYASTSVSWLFIVSGIYFDKILIRNGDSRVTSAEFNADICELVFIRDQMTTPYLEDASLQCNDVCTNLTADDTKYNLVIHE